MQTRTPIHGQFTANRPQTHVTRFRNSEPRTLTITTDVKLLEQIVQVLVVVARLPVFRSCSRRCSRRVLPRRRSRLLLFQQALLRLFLAIDLSTILGHDDSLADVVHVAYNTRT
eukprot:SAG11_NODE_4227_length_2001_cov_1.447424_1_plen_114_part_00